MARHQRCYGRGHQFLNLGHYLDVWASMVRPAYATSSQAMRPDIEPRPENVSNHRCAVRRPKTVQHSCCQRVHLRFKGKHSE